VFPTDGTTAGAAVKANPGATGFYGRYILGTFHYIKYDLRSSDVHTVTINGQ
jgi:hypothetical protein